MGARGQDFHPGDGRSHWAIAREVWPGEGRPKRQVRDEL